jgi:hypothetical protein
MVTHQRSSLVVLATLAGALAGCGGSGPPANPNPVPNPPQGAGGDTFAVTSAGRLVSFNRTSPTTASVVSITGLQANETILGVDLRPGGAPAGQMIALSSMGRLYTIDPNSGTATLKSTLMADPGDMTDPFTTVNGTRVSIDTNNLADALRIISDTGQNLRVNFDTGATFTDTVLTAGGTTAIGVTEVAYTNNFSSTCRTTAYYLDTTADRLMISANAVGGVLTAVGPLGVNAAASVGFDIATGADGTNAAFAVLTTVNNTTALYTIDLTTGTATMVGAIGGLNAGETIFGLAAPAPAATPVQPVGELLALTVTNGLMSFNSNFPQKLCTTATINGLQGGETVLGIDMRPTDSTLYALTNAGRLYTVTPATGTVALKATLRAVAGDDLPFQGLNAPNYAISVSPLADQLRVVSSNGDNLRVVMDTGDTFSDVPLNPSGSSITAGAYTNSFAGTGANTLYVLDTANDRLQIQGRAPNNASGGLLTTIGTTLGINGDVQPIAAFDINASNNTAVAALSVNGASSSDLYSIDLSSGLATRVNSIGSSDRIRSLTYAAVPRATLLGATNDNRLVTFNAATPGTFISNVAINGMQGGEQILGFDIRPSNGLLYLLTDAGRVYIVDPATGMARLGPTLMPNAQFMRLIGSAYGIDFSPTADALRTISDAEHNLAVVVDNGTVITATSLTRVDAEAGSPAPDVVAIAYTNNFAGTTDTTLYDIDVATNSLLTQRPANDGVLTTVGPLTASPQTFSFSGGFDIAGGEDGLAVAALQPMGATQSTLYRVNLRTGLVTPVGPIGAPGTARLMGLTIQLR